MCIYEISIYAIHVLYMSYSYINHIRKWDNFIYGHIGLPHTKICLCMYNIFIAIYGMYIIINICEICLFFHCVIYKLDIQLDIQYMHSKLFTYVTCHLYMTIF